MPTDLDLRPLSTRSVVLSLLLAVHPPQLTVRELIRCVQPLGIAEATLRVALSRMVADGDLRRVEAPDGRASGLREPLPATPDGQAGTPKGLTPDGQARPAKGPAKGPTPDRQAEPTKGPAPDGQARPAKGPANGPAPDGSAGTPKGPTPDGQAEPAKGSAKGPLPAAYRLGERLVERQRRQDEAIDPATKAWRGGGWEMAVVTATGRSPAQRAQLREELTRLRLAELREGVWLRPDNLRRAWPGGVAEATRRFVVRPDEPSETLAGALWTLDGWAARATALLNAFTAATRPADTFTVAAAIVRHLRADPVLPEQLLPGEWPGGRLRSAYAKYQREVMALAVNRGRY